MAAQWPEDLWLRQLSSKLPKFLLNESRFNGRHVEFLKLEPCKTCPANSEAAQKCSDVNRGCKSMEMLLHKQLWVVHSWRSSSLIVYGCTWVTSSTNLIVTTELETSSLFANRTAANLKAEVVWVGEALKFNFDEDAKRIRFTFEITSDLWMPRQQSRFEHKI